MAISADSVDAFKPQVRADVILGPALISGSGSVHYVKDTCTTGFYRIGAKEYFLISRMDGQRTIQEITLEYETSFRRRLNQQAWAQLFGLLASRSLLVQTADADMLQALKETVELQRSRNATKRLSFQLPAQFFAGPLWWGRFIFHPLFAYPSLFAIVLLEAFFLIHAQLAVQQLVPGIMHNYLSIPAVLLISGIFIVAHELAHGFTCAHFGGTSQEIGIGRRFFLPYTYCKIDDVLLFDKRWQRVQTAFAGIFVNLLMIIPFAILWQFTSQLSLLWTICDFVLVCVNLITLANLIPFFDLDGYLMLKYTLNMVDLRTDAFRTWRRVFSRQHTSSLDRFQRIHLIYGFFSIVYTLAFLVGVFQLLRTLL